MSALSGQQESLVQPRSNKHFRIKSASREKMLLGGELLTSRSKRKNSIDETKRIFSEQRNKKSGSIDSALKIRISKDHLAARFDKRPKKIAYEAVKTDVDPPEDTPNTHLHLHTITHELNLKALQRAVERQPRAGSRDVEHLPQVQMDRKAGTAEKEWAGVGAGVGEKKERTAEKEQKGKYRCRVNQYIFDHSRKKSSHCSKQQQQAIDAFWNNVNESMILGGEQPEEASKDLREFVEHFPTE